MTSWRARNRGIDRGVTCQDTACQGCGQRDGLIFVVDYFITCGIMPDGVKAVILEA